MRALAAVYAALLVIVGTSARGVVKPSALGGDARLTDRAQRRVKGWLREAKALVSSDFEAALLKATRPDSAAPKRKHVESIAFSVSAFEAYAGPDCDPYGSLLHKIWSRLAEADARSKVKAVYVLHRLLGAPRCCGDVEFLAFAAAYDALLKSRSSKTESPYFDKRAVLRRLAAQKDVGYDARRWRKFLDRYFTYVDCSWRSVSIAGHPTPAAAALAAAALAALAADVARALPEDPRANPLLGDVTRRLACDGQGLAAVAIVARLCWDSGPDTS